MSTVDSVIRRRVISSTSLLNGKKQQASAPFRLFKDVTLFIVAIAFVAVISWLCILTLLLPAAAPEEKKWAMSILSAAAGGLIGYLIRK